MFCVFSPAFSVRIYLVGFRLKTTGEQIDDRVVEVHWDPALSGWRMMRFRDDKPHGNHKSVVENIIQTIADGVEKETVRSLFFLSFYVWRNFNGYLFFYSSSNVAHPSEMHGKLGLASNLHNPVRRRRYHIHIRLCHHRMYSRHKSTRNGDHLYRSNTAR